MSLLRVNSNLTDADTVLQIHTGYDTYTLNSDLYRYLEMHTNTDTDADISYFLPIPDTDNLTFIIFHTDADIRTFFHTNTNRN